MRVLLPAIGLALGVISAALAGEAACTGYGSLSDAPALALGRVGTAEARTFFVKNPDEGKGCPDAAPACRARAFLVPGDRVILSVARGAHVCADYVGAMGADRAGWLPAAFVVREPEAAVALDDWLGAWSREEAEIAVGRGRSPGTLAIRGDATYGGSDPDRVKRGAVNAGSIEGETAPRGAALSFAMGDKGTIPVERGGEHDCKVWLRRLGPWLLADDNNQCGGFNVTFRGIYRKRT